MSALKSLYSARIYFAPAQLRKLFCFTSTLVYGRGFCWISSRLYGLKFAMFLAAKDTTAPFRPYLGIHMMQGKQLFMQMVP